MSNQQYYTPAVEDIFVGYEGEYQRLDDRPDKWRKIVYDGCCDPHCFANDFCVRTPYLTREQIEAEGWKCYDTPADVMKFEDGFLLYRNNINLRYFNSTKQLRLLKKPMDIFFEGHCPSINEFRRICKMVGIEKKESLNV